MVRLIKAYNERDETIFELSTFGFSERGAKARVMLAFFGRRPSQITASEGIEVEKMPGSGRLYEHRVIIRLDPSKDIKSKIRMKAAVEKLEELI